LRLAPGAPIFRIRVRLHLQGNAVIVDDMRLPAGIFPDLNEHIFRDRDVTVYGMLQARYGITVARTTETLQAELADSQVCDLLGLRPPAPVLRIVRTAYAYKDLPVDLRVRYVDTRGHHYVSALGGG
jgi:GntR family transcriptional regulator